MKCPHTESCLAGCRPAAEPTLDQDSPLTVEEPTSKVESHSKQQQQSHRKVPQFDVSPNLKSVLHSNSASTESVLSSAPTSVVLGDPTTERQSPKPADSIAQPKVDLTTVGGMSKDYLEYLAWSHETDVLLQGCIVEEEES